MHRIVVVGAGYAGSLCATRLARRARGLARVLLVDPREHFVERIRLHQEVASGPLYRRTHRERVHRDVELVTGSVVGADLSNRRVDIEHAGIRRSEAFDSLVLAAGSAPSGGEIPGAREHAHTCITAEDAVHLHGRLAASSSKRVVVIGGGLTGVEIATELAEQRRDLRVSLVTRGQLLPNFTERLREHTRRTFARLGIELEERARVQAVMSDGVVFEHGRARPSDVTVWAGGFSPSPLAGAIGLAVESGGGAKVDARLRSASHPFVHVAGDAAAVYAGDYSRRIRMSCASATPMGAFVADDLLRTLRDDDPRPFSFGFAGRCVSLGRKDAVVQLTDRADNPTRALFTGRVGAFVKELICRYAFASTAMERRGFTYRWPRGLASPNAHAPRLASPQP